MTRRTSSSRRPVIVAGAGPVGLAAALVLARAGIDVLVLEKRASLNTASKASTFHPPTIEILDWLGVAGPLLTDGQRVEEIQYRTASDGIVARFDLGVLSRETRFPLRIHLEQSRVTPVMLAAARRLPNIDVRFEAGVVAVDPSGDRVHVTLEGSWGRQTVEGAFLIAADGARSGVRDALGIGFPGEDYPHKVLRLMTDEDLTRRLPGLAPISYLFNGSKSVSFLKMPDCWRIILRVPGDVDEATALGEDWILDRLREGLPSWDRVPRTVGKDVYGASRRIADRTAVGRALLIGDAAHVTNTRGGMNMNAGIHDALAVATAVARSLADDDPRHATAAAEARRTVASELLIPRTDRSVAGGDGWLRQIKQIADTPGEALAYLKTSAMLDMVDLAPARELASTP